MGHFHDTITGVGKNKQEAENKAIDAFLYENGHRYDVRDCTAESMKKVPPKKWKVVKVEYNSLTRTNDEHMEYLEVKDAPQSEWLEEWTFNLHTHG